MNVQLPVHLDKAGFLDWVEGREGRYELDRGRVIMMVGATKGHGIIVMNIAALIRAQLDPNEWVVIADFGLDAGPQTVRYPDVVVDRPGADSDRMAIAPALLAEVLSPSTAFVDLGDKAAEYLVLPLLSAYLVFAQDEPKASVWVRGAEGFPAAPTVIVGLDKVIHIKAFNIALPLGAVYAGTKAGDIRRAQ